MSTSAPTGNTLPSAGDLRWRGAVSHELNNVLGVIRGNTELILEDPEDRALVTTCAADVLDACEALTQLSWRLQVTGGRVLLHPRPTSLHTWLTGLQRRAQTLGLDAVTFERTASCPEEAVVDGLQLGTAVLHHLADAMHSRATSAKVRLSGTADTLVMDLSDNRPGPLAALGLRPRLTRDAVEALVAHMGGTLTTRTDTAIQQALRLELPIHARTAAHDPASGGLPRHILVVDDERSIGSMLTRVLTREGCEVQAFASPIEALKQLRATPNAYDVALIDVMMPELTGPELLATLRRYGIRLPVVFMTGSAPADTDVLDARGVLTKPFSRSQLLDTLGLPADG